MKRYLTSHGIRDGLWYDPNGRHGQALLVGGRAHNEILRWLREPGYRCTPHGHDELEHKLVP